MYNFVLKQYEGWIKKEDEEGLIRYFNSSKNFFGLILEVFNEYIKDGFEEAYNSIYYQNRQKTVTKGIELLQSKTFENNYIFTYDATILLFLFELYNRDGQLAVEIAIKYLAGEELNTFDQKDSHMLLGLYEFKKPENGIIQRSDIEKKKLQALRQELEDLITTSRKNLEDWHSGEKEHYFRWLDESKNSFEEFDEKSHDAVKTLEELYEQKLQLKAPIKYWEERAQLLRKEGKRWLFGLIGCSVFALVLLMAALYMISDGTLKELYERTGLAIRWSIVFITIISFLAYGIRTFAKLMFSSYHLARDAEERRQLTYVYLALKEDKNIDETERHLVLQSLFSRSDSGLLKTDTSPTMPGNILEKLSK